MDTTEKHIEKLTDKIMNESSLETPSLNFTANIMSQLEKKTISIVYKPLISKKIWALVAACIAIAVIFTFNSEISRPEWLDVISIKERFSYSLDSLVPSLEVPKTYLYSIVFLAIFILIQIPYFKYMYNKRLQF